MKTIKPVKRIVDMKAVIDLPARVYFERYGTPEYWKQLEKELNSEAKDLVDFIRDHRSRDHYSITIEREEVDVCQFCGSEFELDVDGVPVCCEAAMRYVTEEATDDTTR